MRRDCRPRSALLADVLLALVLVAIAGCPATDTQTPVDTGGDGTDTSTDGQRLTGEPNDTFSQAIDITLDSVGKGRLTGTISTGSDVDVYRIGPMQAGDRIILDVSTGSGSLDADAAIFDAGGFLVYENDDRNPGLGQYEPFINHVVRHDSDIYYVAIASSPMTDPATSGPYDAILTVTRGGEVPATAGQIIALDTNGGSAVIDGTTYTVDVFDTADISTQYTGMTSTVMSQIIATTQQNYDGLQLTVLDTSKDTIPATGFSTVLLGGSSANAYGLANSIDYYNVDHDDDAIVFTNMFKPFRFGRTLTATELGTAIGNVVTHEVGHLLGLNHVDNINDLMDTTGGASTLLLDQKFVTSSLDATIFPIGDQNGLMLLLETLGLSN